MALKPTSTFVWFCTGLHCDFGMQSIWKCKGREKMKLKKEIRKQKKILNFQSLKIAKKPQLPQIYFEQPLVSFIILFVWSKPHFGKTNWGHEIPRFSGGLSSGTQAYFLQHSPVGDDSTAVKPIPHIVCCTGHWIFWHWIVESLRHVHFVHTSKCHISPGKWPCL